MDMSVLVFICIGCIILGILLFIIGAIFSYGNKNKIGDTSTLYQSIDDIGLKKSIFQLYKNIMTFSSKYQFDGLRKYIADDYYDEYVIPFMKMKDRKEKLVITGFILKNMDIIDIKKKKDEDVIQVFLCVSQYDYVMKDDNVIRGVEDARYLVEYHLTILKREKDLYLKKSICKGKWISLKN